MGMDFTTAADVITIAELTMNGGLVSILSTGNSTPDAPTFVYQEIIIPAYTDVEITAKADQNEAARLITIGLTGRIYRG